MGEGVRPSWRGAAAATRGRRRRCLAWLAALVLTGAVGLACGPSFQAIYECDVRFEHCYALDQGSAPSDAKKECWREWLHGYTYGQSRDRVEYAAQRFSELSLGNTLPSVDVPEDRRPERAKRANAAPMPTNAFVPPPNVAEHTPSAEPATDAGAAPPTAASAAASGAANVANRATTFDGAPGGACASRCLERWSSCKDGCKGPTCDGCDRAYRACVPACFR